MSVLDDPRVNEWRAKGRAFDTRANHACPGSETERAMILAAVYCRGRALEVIFEGCGVLPSFAREWRRPW